MTTFLITRFENNNDDQNNRLKILTGKYNVFNLKH